MATDFSTATVAPQPALYQHHAYKTSAHYTPMGSGSNTPANISPTSPRSAAHLPTHPNYAPPIRPMKPPLYVPAALRKTEKSARPSPPKVDSVVDTPDGSWSAGAGLRRPTNDTIDTSLSRIPTEDMHSIYNDMPLSPIAGPITRNHWQLDTSTAECNASACQTRFSFFTRRHHCRKCGHIFCYQHSQKKVQLDEHARFHPEGDFHRACDRCHSQFVQWERMRSSRANSESSDSTAAVQIDTPTVAKRPEANRVGSLASSFQGAWNWSTF
ncbi:uncharacterized protein BDR25DRAFT_76893 [Lindgomyces ingoldianus]|uniref:Uncharacterized protein n=1 Tax=Lindgomyces ingoldianus TaxID=673940 RepID=A0ACB6QH82_9PLEO|nr:uncharacterized protein BDR25DRAFT_76893 [Lindgomyces ingoldianus]KAF2466245.1 hypothetical protein BDR25DRAFT_76893 [Lindgomyces ingoldianus]